MSLHAINEAQLPEPFAWPDEMLDSRIAIVGNSGSGKTFAARGLAERLIASKARLCVIDLTGAWWGLRSGIAGDVSGGLPVTIFGGHHADIPITKEDGAALGQIIATSDIRCIIDVSEFPSDAACRSFTLALTTALYAANRQPLHLIIDEADFWAPQNPDKDGPAAALLGRISQIVRRGRSRGFMPWLITQRPAVLNKNVLSQADILVAMKLTLSHDRLAIGAWIKGQAEPEEGERILATLPNVQTGHGYLWWPTRELLIPITFPPNTTFDSGATPKRGEVLGAATLAPIDTAAIAGLLNRTPDPEPVGPIVAGVRADIRAEGYAEGLAAGRAETAGHMEYLKQQAWRFQIAMDQIADAMKDHAQRMRELPDIVSAMRGQGKYPKRPTLCFGLRADLEPMPEADVIAYVERRKPRTAAVAMEPSASASTKPPRATKTPSAPRAGNGAEMRILKVLAQRHPARFTGRQWATLAGMKPTTGTWSQYRSRLRVAGYLDESDGLVSATTAGLKAADVVPVQAQTPLEVREMWKHSLGGGPARMIDALYRHRNSGLDRKALAAEIGISASTGTFSQYLSRLRSNGLISESDGKIELVRTLTHG